MITTANLVHDDWEDNSPSKLVRAKSSDDVRESRSAKDLAAGLIDPRIQKMIFPHLNRKKRGPLSKGKSMEY